MSPAGLQGLRSYLRTGIQASRTQGVPGSEVREISNDTPEIAKAFDGRRLSFGNTGQDEHRQSRMR